MPSRSTPALNRFTSASKDSPSRNTTCIASPYEVYTTQPALRSRAVTHRYRRSDHNDQDLRPSASGTRVRIRGNTHTSDQRNHAHAYCTDLSAGRHPKSLYELILRLAPV